LLTGRYPHRTGVVSLNMETEPTLTRLRPNEITLADLFEARGYATGLVGKWHLGLGPECHPRRRGFQEFAGFIGAGEVGSYFSYELEVDGRPKKFEQRYLTDELSQRAIDFVRRNRERPFFLHLAHYAPHRPLGAPPEVPGSPPSVGFGPGSFPPWGSEVVPPLPPLVPGSEAPPAGVPLPGSPPSDGAGSPPLPPFAAFPAVPARPPVVPLRPPLGSSEGSASTQISEKHVNPSSQVESR
jgi:hypothetical protein